MSVLKGGETSDMSYFCSQNFFRHKDMKHYLQSLEDSMNLYWNHPALCDYKGDSFTFADLAEHIEKFHIFFKTTGLKKGDKVALCAKNTARWGMAFFASNTYETVTVPILVDFHPDSINSLVDHSESKILFTDTEIWKNLDIEKMPQVQAVISSSNFGLLYARTPEIQKAFDEVESTFKQLHPDGFTAADVHYPTDNAGDLAIINYTSGTTSTPKGVMIRYECVTANVDFAQRNIPCGCNDKIVSMLPMAHMYGMMFELIYPVCSGVSVYYLGKTPTPSLLLSAMAHVKPYLVITVPLVMEKIFKTKIRPVLSKPVMKVLTRIPGISNLIFSKIRKTLLNAFGGKVQMIIMGGAALNPDVEKWFKRFRLPYTVGYGMTEAAPLMAYSHWTSYATGSCGRAINTIQVRIDSEDPQHKVGEIQAKGLNIMSGYYKNQEATEAAFTADGWMNTGDLGLIDKDGNIFIKGRSKNMILSSNGQNIYPEEIEAVCNNQDYVIESVVVDRVGKITALLYLDKDLLAADGINEDKLKIKLEEIRNTVNSSMPSYSKIAKIEVVDKPFEKTPKMSIKRFMYN